MPHIQDIHERYGDQVVVLAVSREPVLKMRPFLERNGYTMPVLSIPGDDVWNAYGVRGIPATFLVDREGDLAWAGSPYGVDAELDKLLGFETDPGKLLSQCLAVLGDKEAARPLLERLTRARGPLDLKAWAAGLGLEPLPEGRAAPKLDAEKALERYAKGDAAAAHGLAAHGPEAFDLAGWARERVHQLYPLKAAEVQDLLEGRRYLLLLEALVERKVDGSAMRAAGKDEDFTDFCRQGAEERRVTARKAMMAFHYPLSNRVPGNNDGFWGDLSVSGLATSEDRQRVVGVLIGGSMVGHGDAPAFIRRHLRQHFLMEELGARGKASASKVAKRADREEEAILKELKAKYGWADPAR